jgi:predicted transcriptional regulator
MCRLKLSTDEQDVWQTKRSNRIKKLQEYLKKVGTIEKRKLLGEMGINGVNRETAENYLSDLTNAGYIEEKEGKIIWVGLEDSYNT